MAELKGFVIVRESNKPEGDSVRERHLLDKLQASSLWQSVQGLKVEAKSTNDGELILLVGMIELLVEERLSSDHLRKVASGAYEPDAKARALLRGVKLVEQDLKSSGGAYSLSEVQALMRDISRQAVNNRVREGSILAVPGPSNRAAYPAVQFMENGMPVDGLKEVREALGTENSWMVLNFLVNADPRLDGRRPIDLMKAGKLEQVLEVARRFGMQGA